MECLLPERVRFTVAHSITRVAATLGWAHVPGPPVEAMIAFRFGLPQQAITVALLKFNVGVEIGQLIFVALALAVGALIARLRLPRPGRLQWAASYAIGAVAMFWVIARISDFA